MSDDSVVPATGATNPNLGRLTTVPPRKVWPHEAQHFTPWLLKNVDVLSGLALALEQGQSVSRDDVASGWPRLTAGQR
jgi:hypothetical protein